MMILKSSNVDVLKFFEVKKSAYPLCLGCNMNIPRETAASPTYLYCDRCDQYFSTYSEFHIHHLNHLNHIGEPIVRVVKLNPTLTKRLSRQSYKVNQGVARRSKYVSPLKISLRKQQGNSQFRVIKKEGSEGSNSPKFEHFSQDYKIKLEAKNFKAESKLDARAKPNKTVEGKNNLLERLGATISISRKGVPVLTKVKDEPVDEDNSSNHSNASINSNESGGSAKTAARLQAENLLEQFKGKGISISAKPKVVPTNGNPPETEKIGKIKTIDINQLRGFKPAGSPAPAPAPAPEKKALDLLKGFSGISFAPPKSLAKPEAKPQAKPESKPESPKVNEETEEESKDGDGEKKIENENLSKNEEEDSDEKSDAESKDKPYIKNGSQDGYDSSDSKSNLNEESNKSQTDENSKNGNESETEKVEPQKRIRVKNSLMKKDFEKKSDAGSSSEEQESNLDKDDEDTRGSGLNILKGLTDDLADGLDKQGDNQEDQPRPKLAVMEEANLPPSPPPSEQFEQTRPDFIAPPSECNSPAVGGDSQITDSNDVNNQTENQPDCSMIITPPNSIQSIQDSNDGSNYNPVNCNESYQSKDFDETPTINDDQNQMSFTSLPNEEQSVPTEEQPTYWSDVRDTTVDQPQQDPLMTGDGSVNNGEMNQNYLQIFQNDADAGQSNIPPEGSEFMQYDELAQHQQQSYAAPGPDPNAPMEQLSQQVNRMPNPPGPQINVIPQHHMQAPPPPQLHPGMPISPQHMPQQNQYDPLSHMQPPMPPPLYQGYNMYNQNYTPQAPQLAPRPPPMLQQMPPMQQRIQPRSFQSMAAIPTRPQRPPQRAFPMKRPVRLPGPGPQDVTPPKVRREQSPMQQRQQMQQNAASLAAAKLAGLPSGITITPPKKTTEASKAANVLALRGITVTPASNRQQQQQQQQARVQQQAVRGAQKTQSPIINLNSSISITPSSQNRASGGFAVPAPRRNNAPMVNHNVERPERCMTVDLTQDEDPPQAQRNRLQGQMARFSCNQCTKVFTTSAALESHKASHRPTPLGYKCDKCTAAYPTAAGLQQHRLSFHKTTNAPDLAIPIVDLHHPGAKEQLSKCGIHSFLPLSQLQSNGSGFFGIPIINLDSAKEKAVSNLNTLGAGNIFVLGKMKTLAPSR